MKAIGIYCLLPPPTLTCYKWLRSPYRCSNEYNYILSPVSPSEHGGRFWRLQTQHTLYECQLSGFDNIYCYVTCNYWGKLSEGYGKTSLHFCIIQLYFCNFCASKITSNKMFKNYPWRKILYILFISSLLTENHNRICCHINFLQKDCPIL